MPHDPKITQLRHEGKLTEAINLANDNLTKSNFDEKSKIDYGWVLYDFMKKSLESRDINNLLSYLNKFDELNIPKAENIIHDNVNRYRSYTPEKVIYIDAKKASKEGRHEEAFALYKKAITILPYDTDIVNGLGWEYYFIIKTDTEKLLKSNEEHLLKQIRINLNEFLKLNNTKPSLLYSSILRKVTKISNLFDNYPYFVKEWGLENFSDDGFPHYGTADTRDNNDIWKL